MAIIHPLLSQELLSYTTMRNKYNYILKKLFCKNLIIARKAIHRTQAQMAELLQLDDRNYFNLEHGHSSCSSLTLALFLIYCCTDPVSFLLEIKIAFEDIQKDK